MSTATVPEGREGYFPHWKLKTTGVIMPEERLPWGQTIVSGMQHGAAMAGGTIIAPLIMGFDPNRALLFSGVGTLIFFVVVAGRVPSYLGSSFSFVAVVIAASGYSGHGPNPSLDVALGGIIAAGVLYGVIALIVMQSGIGWVERLMPPIVTGAAGRWRRAHNEDGRYHQEPGIGLMRKFFGPMGSVSGVTIPGWWTGPGMGISLPMPLEILSEIGSGSPTFSAELEMKCLDDCRNWLFV